MSFALSSQQPSRAYVRETLRLLFFKILPAVETLRKEAIRAMHVGRISVHQKVLTDSYYNAHFRYIVLEDLVAALDGLRVSTIVIPGLAGAITEAQHGEMATAVRLDSSLLPDHKDTFEAITIEFSRLGPPTTHRYHSSLLQPPYRLRITMRHAAKITTVVEYTLFCDRKAFLHKRQLPRGKKYSNVIIDVSRKKWEEAVRKPDVPGWWNPSVQHDELRVSVSVYVGRRAQEQETTFRKLELLPFNEASERYTKKLVALAGPSATLHASATDDGCKHKRKPAKENIYESEQFSMLFTLDWVRPQHRRGPYWMKRNHIDKLAGATTRRCNRQLPGKKRGLLEWFMCA